MVSNWIPGLESSTRKESNQGLRTGAQVLTRRWARGPANLEKKERGRERGMNNASLTRTWAHARPVRIAARIPPGLDDF